MCGFLVKSFFFFFYSVFWVFWSDLLQIFDLSSSALACDTIVKTHTMRLVSVLPRSCGAHLLEEFQFYIIHSDSTQIIASEVLLCNCSVQILPLHLITEGPHLTHHHQRILLQPESAHAWKVKRIPDALRLISWYYFPPLLNEFHAIWSILTHQFLHLAISLPEIFWDTTFGSLFTDISDQSTWVFNPLIYSFHPL